jgi:hypothetical protein
VNARKMRAVLGARDYRLREARFLCELALTQIYQPSRGAKIASVGKSSTGLVCGSRRPPMQV